MNAATAQNDAAAVPGWSLMPAIVQCAPATEYEVMTCGTGGCGFKVEYATEPTRRWDPTGAPEVFSFAFDSFTLGPSANRTVAEDFAKMPHRQFCDITRLRRAIDWAPAHAVEPGLRHTSETAEA